MSTKFDPVDFIHPWRRNKKMPDYMIDENTVMAVSFSGGLTSAFMSALLKTHCAGKCIFGLPIQDRNRTGT